MSSKQINKKALLARIQKAIDDYPPMPALYQQALAFMKNPDMDFAVLAEAIKLDPGFTMNVLKVVNSAGFGGIEPVSSIQQALVRLGARNLSRIIVAQGVSSRLAKRMEGYGLEPRELLNHSIGVALTAERLSQRLDMKQDEGALFTAGLLHDLGKMILDVFVLEEKEAFLSELKASEKPFDQLEQDILGITHSEAGASLMRQWNFPEDLVQIVEHHHKPLHAETQKDGALLIHLADTLVYSQGLGAGIDGFKYSVENDTAEKLGLQPSDIEKVAVEVWNKIQEMETLL